jgi:DNA mismatch endonuclease, patch repair protein
MRVPRFTGFTSSSPTASRTKSRTRGRDTKAEVLLRAELSKRRLRYRLHRGDLPGRPDIVFVSAKVVIFCDGDFWHGRRWRERRKRLARGSNAPYWLAKIKSNIMRDRRNNQLLTEAGWTVLRLWETDILTDPVSAANKVETAVKASRCVSGEDQEKLTR